MTTKNLTIQHSSLLVFNPINKRRADAKKVFTTGNDIICGTESGGSIPFLKGYGWKAGYSVFALRRTDAWIAVRRDILVKGTKPVWHYEEMFTSAGRSGDPNGPYGAKGLFTGKFEIEDIGEVNVCTSHFLTKGRRKSQTPPGRFNHYDMNGKFIDAVGAWAIEEGRGRALVFFTGDTNIPDNRYDVFRGEPLTTCWDELDKHPDTGHGNIDVIAQYDRDGRVDCASALVLPLGLHSDHKTIQATYKVKSFKL